MNNEDIIRAYKEVCGILGAVDGDAVKAARKLIAYTREVEWKLDNCRTELQVLKEAVRDA